MRDNWKHCNTGRLEDRATSELIGIAKGLIADGVVNEQESVFLVQWLEQNSTFESWPFDVINKRVGEMLADGKIDADERQELFSLLESLVGGKPIAEHISSFATTLPLTTPDPEIIIPGKTFCFTGKFAFGMRKDCEKAVRDAGGIPQSNVTVKLDYLVIGLMGSEDWAHSSFGRKIQQAIDWNKDGRDIKIIGEDAWTATLCE